VSVNAARASTTTIGGELTNLLVVYIVSPILNTVLHMTIKHCPNIVLGIKVGIKLNLNPIIPRGWRRSRAESGVTSCFDALDVSASVKVKRGSI